MGKRLRVLNVEDSEADVDLLNLHLSHAGYEIESERVETSETMIAALKAKEWDIILCDYSMPHFNALLALDVLRKSGLDIPLIIISGTVGEEIAVEAMLTGAHDYLSKDNLTRLVPAVERELKEAANRRQLRWEGEERRVSEARYRTLFDYAPDGIIISGPDNYYLDANASMCAMLGYSHQELVGLHASDIVIRSEVKDLDFEFALVQSTPDYNREWHFKRKDGSEFPAEVIATIMPDGNLLAMIRDVTDRKNADDTLQEKTALLEAQLDSSIDGILVVNGEGKKIIQNQKLIDLLKIPENIATDTDDSKQVKWVTGMMKFPEQFVERVRHLYSHPHEISRDEIELTDGTILDRYSAPVLGKNNKNYGRIWTFRDMTESKRASNALLESEARLRTIIATEPECVKLLANDGSLMEMNPAGLRMIEADSFEQVADHSVFGLIVENDRKAFKALTKKVFNGGSGMLEFEIIGLKGTHRWLDTHASPLRDASGDIVALLGITRDITESKRAETERRIIFEIIQGSITTPDLNKFLTLVHHSISEMVYAENFIVMLHDAEKDTFEYEYWADTFDPVPQPRPVGNGFGSFVLHSGKPLLLTRELKASMIRQGDAKLSGTPSLSWLGVPLRTPAQTIGVMVVQHYETENAYDQRDLEFLSSVGDQVALAIERNRIEKAVRESEERYRDLVENAIDIIYTHDLNGNYTSVNKVSESVTGYTTEEILKMNIANSVAPEYLEKARDMIGEKLAGNEVTAYEIEIIAKNGGRVAVEVNTRVIYKDAVAVGIQGIARNITDRRQAEDALRESNEKFHQLADNISDVFWVRSLDMKEVYYVSPAFEKIWGRSVESLYADPEKWVDFVYPDDHDRVRLAFSDLTDDKVGFDIEYRIVRPDGEIRWVRLRGFQVKDAAGTLIRYAGIVTDITDRKQVSESLRESEVRYRTLFETSPDALAKFDLNMNVLMANEKSAEIFGFASSAAMIGINAFDLIAPEFHERARANMAVMHKTGQMIPVESIGVKADGSTLAVEFGATLIRNGDGNPEAILGVTRDITERKIADAAMRDSEERFSGAFEFAPIGVALVSPDGHWIKVNRALCELVGYAQDEMLGSTFQDITYKEDLDHDLSYMNRLLAGEITSYQIEKRYVHKLGHLVPVLLNVSLVLDEQGQPRYFISQIQDMTDRKQLEEQFRQSQKMEAVGVLAGGIAHDFNNLLTAINGYSDLTLRRMQADDPLRHNVEEVKKAGDRAAELTSQLLAFSRKQVLKPMVHDLNTAIDNIEKMLKRIIRENIELRTVLDPKLGNIKADPGQVEQVIMNLAVNARDAMPHGGTMTVETHNVYLDDDYVSQNLTIAPGPFVKLTVTDTGVGMDESTKRHIFEPFFTTKEVGKGTGLGLSMVYGVVKQSGGDIMVYSEIGHGTTFKIYFPRVDDAVDKPKWIGDREQKYLGTETILLVEDEDVVRNLVREILADNGYNILECSSGIEALRVCASYDQPIHLLLSDVIMPKMSGSELKDEVVKMLPDIKILFMSGYTDDSIANRGVFDDDIAFIEKPFTPDALSRKVREVLEY